MPATRELAVWRLLCSMRGNQDRLVGNFYWNRQKAKPDPAIYTPRAIVTRLNTELARMVAEPDVALLLTAQGSDPQSSTPEGLAKFLRKDFEPQRKVIASAGLKQE